MKRIVSITGMAILLVAALGCRTRTDKSNGGGLLLSISDFNGLPSTISASTSFAAGQVSIGTVSVRSIVRNPGQGSSNLMTVEIESYEVTFTRDDFGTRVPPKLKNYVFGSVDPNGTFTLNNGPIMRIDQFNNQPLFDMIYEGKDLETNSTVIRFKVAIQFFGRTIAGDIVQSEPGIFTLEVTP